MTLAAGTKLGHYEILSQLGKGGMGEVYLAHDRRLNRKVALKVLPQELAANQDRMRRFEQEAKAAAALNHPNVAHVYEIGEADGLHYIAMEFVEGKTLREKIHFESLELSKLLKYLQQVASGLAKAHTAGIVHRDLKPDNVMISDDGYAKILDFGLAKLIEIPTPGPDGETTSDAPTVAQMQYSVPGRLLGTVGYMSPEQAQAKHADIDHRSDIFSFGCMLYEAVTRQRPFQGESNVASLYKIVYEAAPAITEFDPSAPSELQRIIRRCLAKDPDDRYQTIQDVAIELRDLRRELEGDTQLDRTLAPSAVGGPGPSGQSAHRSIGFTIGGNETIGGGRTIGDAAVDTAPGAQQTSTSSAEYIATGIKRHKLAAILIATVVVVAIVGSILWFNSRSARALTEKDTILLTDFVNTTGDPVFDGTLKQALAVQLGQSPFLNIFSEDRVRETLKYMGRSSDERVDRDVGREICQRQGLKAMLVGSIAGLGNHYVITLQATNAQTGDAIGQEQAEAENKEQVLHALGAAAVKLREKLGESLQSTQKFDAPIEQGTTSSLEAFKAFSLGVEQQLKGKYLEAIPFLKRATDIDPNFALAYGRMASMHYNNRQYDLAAEASQKAFDLRDRVSERERLYISAGYYDNVTGELDKYLETLELWKPTYPRDASPHNNLAVKYNELGQFEKAIEPAREAIRLNPSSASGYSILAAAFVGLNRFDEAREIIGQAQAQGLDTTPMRRLLYRIAFMKGDATAMQQQVDWLGSKTDDYLAQGWQSETAAFSGQLRKAKELSNRAFEVAAGRDLKDAAAQIAVSAAGRDVLFGDCSQVKAQMAKALGMSQRPLTVVNAANALATCGDFTQTQTIIADVAKRHPKDTVLNKIMLPLAQARVEMQKGNSAQAIQLLETTRPYEGYALFQIAYLRGQAYLNQQNGAGAAGEFQKILEHRGSQPTSPMYPLAQLGLARAAALSGDPAKARKAYQDFFVLWKDADPDLPILQEAKREYERLK
jgi:serine/threonine protein kinase/tetratricopeptide (TPR) repeat protein